VHHHGESVQEPLSDTFGGEKVLAEDSDGSTTPQSTRHSDFEKMDPIERFKKARAAGGSADEWGQGEGGYKPPRTPSDRLKYVFVFSYELAVSESKIRTLGRMSRTRCCNHAFQSSQIMNANSRTACSISSAAPGVTSDSWSKEYLDIYVSGSWAVGNPVGYRCFAAIRIIYLYKTSRIDRIAR
jgi:hypothetical protein